jgi:ATP-dependent Clp protease ATP-binding subunit ClpC
MFERFTDKSRRAVVLAQEEARHFNHNYIGTEHLLAGLRRENLGVAAKALESAGITMDAVRAEIQKLVGRGQTAPSGHVPFTPRAKKCLELSLREALTLGHNHIGTGHLLLGLIGSDDGRAIQVLGGLGADLGQLRALVIQEIEDDQEDQQIFAPPRPRRVVLTSGVRDLLDTIDDRLSAIERHLGIARPGDQPAQPEAGSGGPGDGGPGDGGSAGAEDGGSAGAAAG